MSARDLTEVSLFDLFRLEAENQTRFAEIFIGILGHDLRNPLNAISIGAALIKRKGIADDRVL